MERTVDANGAGRIEVLLLGTGTSGQVPSIGCLTDPDGLGCRCCTSTDRKDQRRNTSALLRIHRALTNNAHRGPAIHNSPSSPLNILIDVGKSFCEAAREHFPKHHVRRLDAVLLTHPHADAINGLDDLRAWTLGRAIQDSIAIYCNEYTHSEVSRMYPYLVDSKARTGGGDVPQFTWNIIRDGDSFNLFGIEILPLPVHHGKFFEANKVGKPYLCTSYLIANTVYYVSDVSMIPEETLKRLEQTLAEKSGTAKGGDHQESLDAVRLKVLIIDTLRLLPHPSHFGIAQSIEIARILRPVRTYLIGFTHRVSHDCWTYCCQAMSQSQRASDFEPSPSTHIYPGQSGHPEQPAEELLEKGIVEDYDWFTGRALRLIEANLGHPPAPQRYPDQQPWVRPGFDGLVIHATLNSSSVTDTFYD